MRPHPCRALSGRRPHESGHDPLAQARVTDGQQRQAAADIVGVARCPRCRAPLVARMGCRGPYFHCACAESVSSHYERPGG
jgi:hypothetical protein